MRVSEDLVYAGVALVLLVGAGIVLVEAVVQMVAGVADGGRQAVLSALDALLLVFILVELLAAVRATLRQRDLVAEPFLLVGMIATIKEIVVASLGAKELAAIDLERFRATMQEIGVLAGVLVALGITTFLVRRKEREPQE